MLIYNSMIVWIALLSIIYNRRELAYDRSIDNPPPCPKIVAVLVFGYIAFWAAIRSGVADTAGYIFMFRNAPSNLGAISQYWDLQQKAPGFNTIQVIIKSVTSNYHVWLAFIVIICCFPITRSLRLYSDDFFLSAFLFITTLNFFWLFNGIRQFIVAAIVFGKTDLIIERRTAKFMLLIAVLSTIHFTAWIFVPVYFLVTGEPFGKKMLLFVVAVMVAAVFVGPFVSAMDDVLSGTTYSGYTTQFEFDDGVNPFRTAVSMVPVVISFINRRRIDWREEPLISLCMNMSLISAGLYFVGIFTSGVLIGRLPIYFEMYNLLLYPKIINRLIPERGRSAMKISLIIGFLLYYYLQMRGSYYISDLTGFVG